MLETKNYFETNIPSSSLLQNDGSFYPFLDGVEVSRLKTSFYDFTKEHAQWELYQKYQDFKKLGLAHLEIIPKLITCIHASLKKWWWIANHIYDETQLQRLEMMYFNALDHIRQIPFDEIYKIEKKRVTQAVASII